MTPEQEETLWHQLSANDDGSAARDHLARGFPVYFHTTQTPPGVIEKLYPNGHRQYVRFDLRGEHFVADFPTPHRVIS
ncbi:MAG TPA: hypothetical protein VL689_02365 [Paraburkholderia sp.]|jgi:hypothetical protein|nr:hypothetical protein [Paraburkholderia sp.]